MNQICNKPDQVRGCRDSKKDSRFCFNSMAYSSGASQIIYARQCWTSGSEAMPEGVVARASNLEMQPLWDSGINKRISKRPLNLLPAVGVKKKEIINKIVAKGVAAKLMSNNTPKINYDVFVSFRGEDIRHSFLSHLTKAFPQKQINAFVDDKLKRGDDISPALLEAIEGSFISLIIFSENYASSHWCLDELVKIHECKEKYGQIVIPVFYKVDPSDVRHQRNSYENALTEHEKKYNLHRVQIWRQALNKSANLSGIKSFDFRNDADLLEDIISRVLMRLSMHPINTKGLIGMDKPIAYLESLLCQESKEVRVIGIWGMGGIGKTTMAEEIFNKRCSEYEGFSFLAKVKEQKDGIESLKKKLFSKLLGEDVNIDTPNGLSSYIKRRIGRMKVLIVLDDVDDADLVENIFGTLDWLQSGSRIIITTRDKQVLIANKVDDIYQVGELSSSEALELFNLNAFNQTHLEMGYDDLSQRVVNYAKGSPLVLKVLGRLLCGKDTEVWESQLDKLSKMPIKKVHDVMRLSYDDLDCKEQKFLLDIACFFNGLKLKVSQLKILLKDHENDNSVVVGLERLKDRALMTISEDNVVSMHDIIQEMGREIVRQESEDPGRRTRLWDPEDICDVLKNNKGTEAIRSIKTDYLVIRNLALSPYVFAKMSKLQFLKIHGGGFGESGELFPQGLKSWPNSLKYIYWMHYPLKSLPENFSAENLVILELPFGLVQRLWHGVKNLVNLIEVALGFCALLEELPDFSKAINLEVLYAISCFHLKSVHPSIFSLDKLERFSLNGCMCITEFTSDTRLSSLRYLDLGWCTSLWKLSVMSENITELRLGPIRELPSSFGRQSKVEILDLRTTDNDSFPGNIMNNTRLLRSIPVLPPSIETLLAGECRSLKTVLFPSTAAEQFKENRKTVEFWNCVNLEEHSLRGIGLNAQINLMKHTYQHPSTPEHDDHDKDEYGFDRAVYVYPGCSVPTWLEYKTTEYDMIIDLSPAQLSPLLGFIFCFVLAGEESRSSLKFEITIIDGEGDGKEKGGVDIYMTKGDGRASSIELDHVCLIYDKKCSLYLTGAAKNQTRFKIKVAAYEFEHDREVNLKLRGFGVSPVNTLTYQNFIQQVELFDYINKWNQILLSIILCISFVRLKKSIFRYMI